jgi:NAD(P)-dependent dehydrogenase (short-subunit alcohol dehydrogenase family)
MGPRLEGQVAIVTGGSAGIGRATCLALAREGAHVVVFGRNADRLAETVALLAAAERPPAARSLALRLDVRSAADMEEMAARTLAEFGRIDVLVSSAGILRASGAAMRPAASLPLADWDEVLDTNLRGTFLSNRAVLPAMLAQRAGNIVNLSSIAGRAGMAFDAPYSASKFGVVGLSEALAEEVRPHGVRVQVLLPGPFQTELLHRRWSGAEAPPGTFPPASRVADLIVHLVTMPPDTRLVAPVFQPMAGEPTGGWQAGRAAAAPRAGRGSSNHSSQEQHMADTQAGRAGRLDGKVVIVTGGASGIGLATGQAAAREGASVVVADLNPERVHEAVEALTRLASPAAGHLGVAMDVRSEADNEALARQALERFGRIDALVASAGILRKRGTSPKPLVKTSTEEWDEVLGVNLKGIFLSNRAVLPAMIRQRSGTIINISSVSGLEGRAHDAPYCASKFGVIGFSQSVADEVRGHGVKVQAVMPDAVNTPIWEQNYPVPRPGDALAPERVAEVILFLLTLPEDTVLTGSPVIAPLGARRRRLAGKAAADAAAAQGV